MLQLIFSSEFFFAILRITAPILLVTLAADICEKAGVSNIGLEGTMMISQIYLRCCIVFLSIKNTDSHGLIQFNSEH